MIVVLVINQYLFKHLLKISGTLTFTLTHFALCPPISRTTLLIAPLNGDVLNLLPDNKPVPI